MGKVLQEKRNTNVIILLSNIQCYSLIVYAYVSESSTNYQNSCNYYWNCFDTFFWIKRSEPKNIIWLGREINLYNISIIVTTGWFCSFIGNRQLMHRIRSWFWNIPSILRWLNCIRKENLSSSCMHLQMLPSKCMMYKCIIIFNKQVHSTILYDISMI